MGSCLCKPSANHQKYLSSKISSPSGIGQYLTGKLYSLAFLIPARPVQLLPINFVALCKKLTKKIFVSDYIPTKEITNYETSFDDQKWNIVDTPGEKRMRMMWSHLYVGANAIIYVLDAEDKGKWPEAKAVIFFGLIKRK
jgi:hypothetical protein